MGRRRAGTGKTARAGDLARLPWIDFSGPPGRPVRDTAPDRGG